MISIGTASGDTAAKQQRMAKANGWQWLKLFDEYDEAMQAYNIQFFPTVALIDPDGNVVAQGAFEAMPAIKQTLSQNLGVTFSAGGGTGGGGFGGGHSHGDDTVGKVFRTGVIVLIVVAIVLLAIKRPK